MRQRLERQLQRRARELGYVLTTIESPAVEAPTLEQVMVDGEVVTVKSDSEIVSVA